MLPSMCAAAPILTSSLFPAENRQKLWVDELRKEYYEEQQNEFENFAEEQSDGESSQPASPGKWGSVGKSRAASTSP